MQSIITEKQSNLIKLTYNDRLKKLAHYSQIVRTKETLSQGGPSQTQPSDMKVSLRPDQPSCDKKGIHSYKP